MSSKQLTISEYALANWGEFYGEATPSVKHANVVSDCDCEGCETVRQSYRYVLNRDKKLLEQFNNAKQRDHQTRYL